MECDQARQLAGKERACIVAPAGYGKTEVIAKSVALHTRGRQLILTHTHAGVRALRARLTRFGATYEDFHLDTIAGFSLRYAISFPKLSGLPTVTPITSPDWNAVYAGAEKLFRHPGISRVVARSFDGLYVDEYQDCSAIQHKLVMALAGLMPCRVVGDPLQGIFDFSDSIVDWDTEVFPNFERIGDLTTPWRWVTSNPELGAWLDGLRERLMNHDEIDLDHAALDWVNKVELPAQIVKCKELASEESVVGIRQWAPHCHVLAQKLGGTS